MLLWRALHKCRKNELAAQQIIYRFIYYRLSLVSTATSFEISTYLQSLQKKNWIALQLFYKFVMCRSLIMRFYKFLLKCKLIILYLFSMIRIVICYGGYKIHKISTVYEWCQLNFVIAHLVKYDLDHYYSPYIMATSMSFLMLKLTC